MSLLIGIPPQLTLFPLIFSPASHVHNSLLLPIPALTSLAPKTSATLPESATVPPGSAATKLPCLTASFAMMETETRLMIFVMEQGTALVLSPAGR